MEERVPADRSDGGDDPTLLASLFISEFIHEMLFSSSQGIIASRDHRCPSSYALYRTAGFARVPSAADHCFTFRLREMMPANLCNSAWGH
jgi:hypothetical protein